MQSIDFAKSVAVVTEVTKSFTCQYESFDYYTMFWRVFIADEVFLTLKKAEAVKKRLTTVYIIENKTKKIKYLNELERSRRQKINKHLADKEKVQNATTMNDSFENIIAFKQKRRRTRTRNWSC